jgi:hypothetical protein
MVTRTEIESSLNIWREKQISFLEKIEITDAQIERLLNWIVLSKEHVEKVTYDQTNTVIVTAISQGHEVMEKLNTKQQINLNARDKAAIKIRELEAQLKE